MKVLALLLVCTVAASCDAVDVEPVQQKDADQLGRVGDFAPALVNLFLFTGYPHAEDDRFRSASRADAVKAVSYWLARFYWTLSYSARYYAVNPELVDLSYYSSNVRYAKLFWRLEALTIELMPDLVAKGDSEELIRLRLETIKVSIANMNLDSPSPDTRWFQDVPEDHWADFAIHKLRRAGILYGYPDGTFKV